MGLRQSYYVVWRGGGNIDWSFNPRFRGQCELPMVLCPQCETQYSGDAFSALPEPVPATVRKVLRGFRSTDLVLPSKFARLELLVRQAYRLPPERRVEPGISLGALYLIRKRFEPAWHVYHSWAVDRTFFTSLARQRLESLRSSNLLWFPLLDKEGQSRDIWQLVVLGIDVVPEIDVGEWWQCSECGHWRLDFRGHESVGFEVPDSATGEDFVHLAMVGLVVSERVVEILRTLGDGAVWGLDFIPLAQWRRRQFTPADIEEGMESFEELAKTIRPPEF